MFTCFLPQTIFNIIIRVPLHLSQWKTHLFSCILKSDKIELEFKRGNIRSGFFLLLNEPRGIYKYNNIWKKLCDMNTMNKGEQTFKDVNKHSNG